MEWKTLLSADRERGNSNRQKSTDLRSEFEKDYHRIIGSASFRRLQDKTQVFPLDKSDFIRTRLTHSLEVSSLGKSLGQNIGENILNYRRRSRIYPADEGGYLCISLNVRGSFMISEIRLSDISGRLPYGNGFSAGCPELTFCGKTVEDMLSGQMKQDLYHFEGNAQALRLVTKLHYLVDEHGMNLTYALLNTIVKYPVPSTGIDPESGNIKDKKMGYYLADEKIFQRVTQATGAGNNRHPLTYILEAADDLAYKTADIEDAFVKGFITYYILEKELAPLEAELRQSEKEGRMDYWFKPLEKLHQLYERGKAKNISNPESYAVKNWIVSAQGFLISCATFGFTSNYDRIMAGTFQHDLFHGTFGEKLMDLLGDMAYRYVFSSMAIYKMEVSESAILDYLMEKLVQAVLYYDTDIKQNTIDTRVVSFISDNYKNAYKLQAKGKKEEEKLYLRLLLVTDYVCGMTDSYAKRLYQEMNGIV